MNRFTGVAVVAGLAACSSGSGRVRVTFTFEGTSTWDHAELLGEDFVVRVVAVGATDGQFSADPSTTAAVRAAADGSWSGLELVVDVGRELEPADAGTVWIEQRAERCIDGERIECLGRLEVALAGAGPYERSGIALACTTQPETLGPCVEPDLRLDLIAEGFVNPVWAGAPPGDHERLYVAEQHTGRVHVVDLASRTIAGTFLDLGGEVDSGGEGGLLALAFHPEHASNARFFASFTNPSGDTRVTEHLALDPLRADATPVRTILALSQPYSNHNGGNVAFGPDGMLYVGLGDGGSGYDPQSRAQDGATLLGKMLRLDVDAPPPHLPADNPFADDGDGVLDEIWALGLRNPWRWSFDRATGDLYLGDVGQSAWEEIDFQRGDSAGGENYGWRCMEGDDCTGLSGCACFDDALEAPIHAYPHAGGDCSVTGGFVYRGAAVPALEGLYLFADYCTARIWTLRCDRDTRAVGELRERVVEVAFQGALALQSISSFAEDAAGEVYVLDHGGGRLFRILDAE